MIKVTNQYFHLWKNSTY